MRCWIVDLPASHLDAALASVSLQYHPHIHDIIEFYWEYVAPSPASLADVESFAEINFSPQLRHLMGAERPNECRVMLRDFQVQQHFE